MIDNIDANFEYLKKRVEVAMNPMLSNFDAKARDDIRTYVRGCKSEEELSLCLANLEIQDIKINLDEVKKGIEGKKDETKINNNQVIKAIGFFSDKKNLAEQFLEIWPIFYDKAKIWWQWNANDFCWEQIDETDILNAISECSNANTIRSKDKSEILESLKQIGRKNAPKPIKRTWIQFKGKIVDIETDEIFDASPKYFVCNPIPWNLGTSEDTPMLDKYFVEWVGEENKKKLYQIAAFCLLSDYPIHRVFCFFGEGLNGKSCFLRFLKLFLGVNNCTSTELELLLTSRFEISRMYKKLACFMTETNFEEMEKTSMLKKLTGQDLIGYEFKQKALIDDLNYAKILIATNNLPPTTDKTIGFYRRWMIIDFLNKFKEGIDPIILIPNIEFENLAKKSIEMLKELLKEGIFNNEGEIEERMKRYEDRSNPFDKFWKENVVEDSERFIGKTEFKNRLEEWCKENKFRIISERTITKKMEELKIFEGFEDYYIDLGNGDRERKKYRIWRGINWKSGTDATLGTHNPTSPISREKQVGLQVPAVPNVPFSSIFDDKVRFNEEEQEIVEEKVK